MRDCLTMEDLGVGAEEGGEEIELSLGLSIGGNSRKSQRTANADVDLGQENRNCSEFMEQQRRREVQALMRQEARRKRDEKLRKRGLVTGLCEDNAGAEAQRVEIRARERERRENEAKVEGRECAKREKNEERGHNNGAENVSQQGSVPVVPYPPLQFVPLGNGFVYPCVVPCLGTPGSSGGGREENDGGVLRPVACRGFWPGQGGLRPGDLVMGGSDSECKRGKDGGNLRAAANGSPVRGSPEASEIQSSSQQGGSSSSDTGSHSSHRKPESQLKYACENGVPSSQTETTRANCETTKNTNSAAPFRAIKSSPTKLLEQTDSKTQSNPEDKPLTSENPNPGSVKVASDEGLGAPSSSQMPCVSTTGNGPNGKTITGFLYRYTKTEVSIVCVCHGSSFSPAEFVEHAGGEDITHPLRHITVVPSAF